MNPRVQNKQATQEQVSALMDGHLDATTGSEVVCLMANNPELHASWHAYQIIGDVLRDPSLAPANHELAFLERLRPALESESQGLRASLAPMVASTPSPVRAGQESANAPVFHWKALAGVAVLALALGVAWGDYRANSSPARLATAAPPASQATGVQPEPVAELIVRDPELDALLLAHQQMGGSSAWQKPSGFLRNATYTRPGR